jgi:hypothetical protein
MLGNFYLLEVTEQDGKTPRSTLLRIASDADLATMPATMIDKLRDAYVTNPIVDPYGRFMGELDGPDGAAATLDVASQMATVIVDRGKGTTEDHPVVATDVAAIATDLEAVDVERAPVIEITPMAKEILR